MYMKFRRESDFTRQWKNGSDQVPVTPGIALLPLYVNRLQDNAYFNNRRVVVKMRVLFPFICSTQHPAVFPNGTC